MLLQLIDSQALTSSGSLPPPIIEKNMPWSFDNERGDAYLYGPEDLSRYYLKIQLIINPS